MVSSGFKSIAVAGAQSPIGKATVTSLAAIHGVSVLVLTRQATSRPDWLPAGVAHAGIDYADVNGTAALLRTHGIEVVIAPVSTSAVLQQIPLARAAKAAGVQLFVPSEFGTLSKGWKREEVPPYLLPKIQVAEFLESIGLPSVRVYPGCFVEFITTLVGYDANKKVNILKSLKGDTPFSATTNPDIGAFLAHIVTHYPLAELANKAFRIEGERLTFNDLGGMLNAPVIRVDEIPVVKGGPFAPDFLAEVQRLIELGLLNTDTRLGEGDGAGGANHLWENHHWTTTKEFLQL
ncbi:hypothetical protein HDZ31DRAFT_36994 [Schizophyllum fasciatum]